MRNEHNILKSNKNTAANLVFKLKRFCYKINACNSQLMPINECIKSGEISAMCEEKNK